MKAKALTMALSILGTIGCSAESPKQTALEVESSKILIAYYSWSSNTRAAAEQIQRQTGGKLFEIKPLAAYPIDYKACTEQAQREINEGFRPELASKIEDIEKYDVIFIGSPNWWGTIAPPAASFLTSGDFTGKTIVPFFTHGGGGMQNCEKDLRKLGEKYTVRKAATFRGSGTKSPSKELEKWVNDSVTLKQAEKKTFPPSDKVSERKVFYPNRYDIRLAGDLYLPANLDRSKKHPAIIVGHPYGGVKEQCAGLYAQTMAERGFIALAFDLSYAGESGGTPRQTVSPETYVEDFSASVDFLGTLPLVDRNRIGVIGICGSGGFSIGAASVDPRIRALATVSMYDMGRATRQGLNDAVADEQRAENLRAYAEMRWREFEGAEPALRFGTPEKLPKNANEIAREFYAYYRTERGWHPRYLGQKLTSMPALMNFYPFANIRMIAPRPILFVVGENAHSRYFSEDAYQLAAEPRELYVVPQAGHVDLYDRLEFIPFDKLTDFFTVNMPAAK